MDIASLSHGLIEVTTWQDRLLQWLERIYASPKMYQWSLGTLSRVGLQNVGRKKFST
jgi:hypothetical protein